MLIHVVPIFSSLHCIWDHLPPSQRTFCDISCSEGLLEINPISVCVCLGKPLFRVSVCKALLLGREFWTDRFLSFSVLDTGLHWLLTCLFNGKSSIHLCSFVYSVLFSGFNILSLSLTLSNLIMMYFDVVFFIFLVLEIHQFLNL